MLEVRLLGPVEVGIDGEPVEIGSASQRLILAALGRQPGSVVSVDALAEMLWADDRPATATATLQAYVSRLRRSTGSHRIVTHTGGYSLADATTDIDSFEKLIEGDQLELLEQALAMWRGEPYGEFADREPFRWDTHRLGEMYRAAQERHAELLLVENPPRAAADLQALCRMEPLRERRWELLARALASGGRYAEALRALETARQALAEVGLEPSPTLAALADELLESPPALPTWRGDGIRVPSRPSPLVGRQRELEDLARLLAERRLVTLVGPGGVGKTSLAQVAASAVEHFDGGVYWCELAPHADRSALVPAVALAVEAPVVGDIENALIRHLRDRRVLIVFDNCEHVIGEAARLAEVLITRCPRLTMLATSREPLAIAAERVVEIRPLEGGSSAVDLFVERAVAGGVAIDVIDRQAARKVCELVDGLPLAVEMAAARVRSLGITELTRRLTESMNVLGSPSRTANVRHRTLEAVVDWSADLLDPVEKTVLQRASVFAGGFDLEAAEKVIGYDPVRPHEVAGLLGHLIDRSLLTVDHLPEGLRYSMLDTIRWVASSWRTDPTDRLQRHHAEYYARLAESIGTHLLGPDEARWANRTAIELANLRLAVFGSLDEDTIHVAVRICAGLHQFVYQRLRADVAAWSAHLFPLVERSGLQGVPTVAASAALGAVQKGDLELARSWCRRGRAASSTQTDLLALIEVECDIATYEGRYDDAVGLSRELVEVARSTSSRSSEVAANAALALALAYTGHTDDALAVVADMRDLVASTESDTSAAWSYYVEGEILLDREPDRAADLLDKAVVLARRTGAVFPEGVAGVSAASLRARHGDPAAARTRFAETIRRWRSTGDWVHQWVTLRNLAVLLDRLEDHEGAVVILGAVTGRVHPPHGEEARRLEDLATSLRSRLGGEEYQRLTEEGRRLGDNAVVDLALSRLTAPTGAATLLITDIVGSTQLVAAIGDDAWLELLEWHNRTLHELIGAHGGQVVDRTGDGYLAMFSSPLQAVAGAIAIQRTLRQHRREAGFAPRLRIAVHHGPVTYEDGSPRGLEVHVTARIVDAAKPDEILASAALADQFGIDISNRRKVAAKGIELPVEVGTVSW